MLGAYEQQTKWSGLFCIKKSYVHVQITERGGGRKEVKKGDKEEEGGMKNVCVEHLVCV